MPLFRFYPEDSIGHLLEQLSEVSQEAIRICTYIELNITGMRKILKKFDKKFRDVKQPLKDSYIISRL